VPKTLADLTPGTAGVVGSLDARPDVGTRLMELGFIPGACVEAVRDAPGGNPRVYRVDGGEIALRLETARLLRLRPSP
jgi:Fe2+ transport system protein FeoA